jgi:hypothetical protein
MKSFALKLSVVLMLLACGSRLEAAPIAVMIDTSAIRGVSAQLVFDFIDGGGPHNNIELSALITDGITTGVVFAGGASGSLPGPVNLTDTVFYSELAITLTLGTSVSFRFQPTNGGGGITPDEFSIFLLDATANASLFDTSDPTGANALLAFDITGEAGRLFLFSATQGEVIVSSPTLPVPEPVSLILIATGLLMRAARSFHRPART